MTTLSCHCGRCYTIRGQYLDFKWAFKKLPKSIPEALKKNLRLWLDEIFLAEGIDLIIPNFLPALVLSAVEGLFLCIKTKKIKD